MTERKVEEIFSRELQVEVPSRETDVIDTGLIDSLTFVQLLSILEREFQFEIDLEQLRLDDFRTVSSIAGFLDARMNGESTVATVAGD